MDQSFETTRSVCPSPEISAYVDGELSASAQAELEVHIAECRLCAEEMNLQKSFLNVLGSSLDGAEEIDLPRDFAKSVVTNAESRVSGLRHPHERRNAAFICTALVVFSLFALGGNAGPTFAAASSGVERVAALAAWVGHFFYDIALGSTIVFRTLASALLFDSTVSKVFIAALFVLSLYVFSRLLGGFRRT